MVAAIVNSKILFSMFKHVEQFWLPLYPVLVLNLTFRDFCQSLTFSSSSGNE